MEALRDAVAGTQQDVYESTDILSDDNGTAITFATGDTISFTIGSTTLTSSATATSYSAAINDLITKINTDATLSTQVEAKNINGKLVIETKRNWSRIFRSYEIYRCKCLYNLYKRKKS